MVSIAAFQAVDPGSIPGRRRLIFIFPSLWDQVFIVREIPTACPKPPSSPSLWDQVFIVREIPTAWGYMSF